MFRPVSLAGLEEVSVRIGVVFPQTEIGNDPVAIRDYAQAVEQLGYSHLLAYDHVLGAHPDRPGGWNGPYTHESAFHEPFVLFAYLAGVTSRLELVTGIIILPQRQTALVAKQAAAVDVLSGGRLRLGVGIGWNAVEYEALGENFHDRGRRLEEQVEVMRSLWTEPVVTFVGRWHRITQAGINPLPVQRPIPLWMGGMSEPVLRRVARIGDGWCPQSRPFDEMRAMLKRLSDYALEAGRDPTTIGIEGRVDLATGTPDEWVKNAKGWRDLGATHVSLNTMRGGFGSADGHLKVLRRFQETIGRLD